MTGVVDQDSLVLVTGGTGSFGSTMVHRLLHQGVGEIRVLSRDELKQHKTRTALANDRVRFYMDDVRDYGSVGRVTRGVELVFHAAAIKHVPSCEFFPMEAARTNVMGSSDVSEGRTPTGSPGARGPRAEDQGDSYLVPLDLRDPNHHQYLDEDDVAESRLDDYHLHNTERLDVEAVREVLLDLRAFQALLSTSAAP